MPPRQPSRLEHEGFPGLERSPALFEQHRSIVDAHHPTKAARHVVDRPLQHRQADAKLIVGMGHKAAAQIVQRPVGQETCLRIGRTSEGGDPRIEPLLGPVNRLERRARRGRKHQRTPVRSGRDDAQGRLGERDIMRAPVLGAPGRQTPQPLALIDLLAAQRERLTPALAGVSIRKRTIAPNGPSTARAAR
jgi:hypothetical protein